MSMMKEILMNQKYDDEYEFQWFRDLVDDPAKQHFDEVLMNIYDDIQMLMAYRYDGDLNDINNVMHEGFAKVPCIEGYEDTTQLIHRLVSESDHEEMDDVERVLHALNLVYAQMIAEVMKLRNEVLEVEDAPMPELEQGC